MKVAVFSAKSYDECFLTQANTEAGHELVYFEPRLNERTAALAAGFPAVCVFVHDQVDATVASRLAAGGTRLIALRCAGFNNVDLVAAAQAGLKVVRVPAYSPHAVAEHAVALMLALNRKIHKAYTRVRDGDFSLSGLMGFDLHGKSFGVVGTGKIGAVVATIMRGFGCRLLAFDKFPNPEVQALGTEYVPLPDLFAAADVISLHCPLTHETYHMVNDYTLKLMKPGAMLVNTSRGPLIDTQAVIEALKSGRLGALALDVYEEEDDLFYENLSMQVIRDDIFSRLLTFPNVLITGHQAFFTHEALAGIAATTIANINDFAQNRPLANEVQADRVRK